MRGGHTAMLRLSEDVHEALADYEAAWSEIRYHALPVPIEFLARCQGWMIGEDPRVAPAVIAGMVSEPLKLAAFNPGLSRPDRRVALAWLIARQIQGETGAFLIQPGPYSQNWLSREILQTVKITSRLLIPDTVFRECTSFSELRRVCGVPSWLVAGRLASVEPAERQRFLTDDPREWGIIRGSHY